MKKSLKKPPTLKRIDLSKSYEDDEKWLCPGINNQSTYLAKIGDEWHAGTFSAQWYGWSFDWNGGDVQYDPPGENSSEWEELYEIVKR